MSMLTASVALRLQDTHLINIISGVVFARKGRASKLICYSSMIEVS